MHQMDHSVCFKSGCCPQVSSLEQQLERARASLQDEVRRREQEAQEKAKNLQEVNQQNAELSGSVRYEHLYTQGLAGYPFKN